MQLTVLGRGELFCASNPDINFPMSVPRYIRVFVEKLAIIVKAKWISRL